MYERRNKTIIRESQNLIDLSIQEYGTPEAVFKIIDLNPELNLNLDSALDPLVTNDIFADNQSEEQIELIRSFDLGSRIVVNEDILPLLLEDIIKAHDNAHDNAHS